jgi:hypothetical protein
LNCERNDFEQQAPALLTLSLASLDHPGKPCAVSFPLTKSLPCGSRSGDGRLLCVRRDTRPEPIHCDIYRVLRIPQRIVSPIKRWTENSH